jgi:hypothetical protein
VLACLENKDLFLLNDRTLQPVEECEHGQGDKEANIKEPHNGPEILEQTVLRVLKFHYQTQILSISHDLTLGLIAYITRVGTARSLP